MQDRIKELALEAGFPSMTVDNISETDAQRMLRLVQAVARECAKLADDSDYGPVPHHIGDQIRARFGIAKE